MTVPVIPGPFSFIGELGEALANVERAKQNRQIQEISFAKGTLDTIMQGVQSGMISSAMFSRPDIQALTRKAFALPEDVALPVSPILTAGEATGAIKLGEVSRVADQPAGSTERRAIAELPSQTAVAIEQAQAGAIAAGGASGRAVTGVPSEQVAAAQEAGTIAQSQVAQAQAGTATQQAELDQEVIAATRNVLAGSKEIKELTARAQLGILGLDIARIQASRATATATNQRQRDLQRLILDAYQDADQQYRQRLTDWERCRQNARTLGIGDEADCGEAPDRNAITEDVISTRAASLEVDPQELISTARDLLNLPGLSISSDRLIKIQKAATMVMQEKDETARQQAINEVRSKLRNPAEIAAFMNMVSSNFDPSQLKLESENELEPTSGNSR